MGFNGRQHSKGNLLQIGSDAKILLSDYFHKVSCNNINDVFCQ